MKTAPVLLLAFVPLLLGAQAHEARGGSMAPMLYGGTQARLTEERIAHLKLRLGEE